MSGFQPSGEDDNLLASINDATNERAYIPTTSNPLFFHDFAHGAALDDHIWVYEIRATRNFYNATGSIEWPSTIGKTARYQILDLQGEHPDSGSIVGVRKYDGDRRQQWFALEVPK